MKAIVPTTTHILTRWTDNTCIYPALLNILEMGQASFVYKITPALFQKGISRPAHVRFGIVRTAVSYRMNQTRNYLDSDALHALEKTLLHYRGLIIRSLSHDIGAQDKRTQEVTLFGIMTLLLADVSR